MCLVLFVVSKILDSSELLSCLLEMGVEYYLVQYVSSTTPVTINIFSLLDVNYYLILLIMGMYIRKGRNFAAPRTTPPLENVFF